MIERNYKKTFSAENKNRNVNAAKRRCFLIALKPYANKKTRHDGLLPFNGKNCLTCNDFRCRANAQRP